MATTAQVLANQANAIHSTGPVTPEGKARASHNAATLGLFSASAFIRPDEQDAYEAFRAAWQTRLVPDGPLEATLVSELVQAAWRLRRCTLLETTTPDATTLQDLDRIQASIDRARSTAQRALQRNLTELRRIQTDRLMRDGTPYGYQARAEFGAASVREIDNFFELLGQRYLPAELRSSPATQRVENSKRTQSIPAPKADFAERSQSEPAPIPRNARCPCESGEKYKRCCGKTAPPVLSRAA
jgi:hypothetical protein